MTKNLIIIILLFQMSCFQGENVSDNINSTESNVLSPEVTSKPNLSIPDGWIIISKPNKKSRIVQCAGSDREFQWRVEPDGEKISISKYDEWAINEQIEKLPLNLRETVLQTRDIGNGSAYFHIEPYENGWLAGLDAGEWGGRLTWFSSDGKQKVVISRDNIQGIATVGNEVLILQGLNHLNSDQGSVSKLTKGKNGDLLAQNLADLKSKPKSFVVESSESILISVGNRIVRVKTSGEIEDWRDMPLNKLNVSMARTKSGIIYSGMWLFVVRFIPSDTGLQEQWLIPDNCQNFTLQKNSCRCHSR